MAEPSATADFRESSLKDGSSASKTRLSWRERGLHLVALASFAVAQPLFDLIARYPAFLVAHDAELVEILLLVASLCLGLPLAMLLLEETLGLLHRRLALGLHLVFVVVLLLALALQVLRSTFDMLWPTAGFAVGLAVLLATLYWRFKVFRSLTSVLAVGGLVFPLLFLLNSPVRRLAFPSAWIPIVVSGPGATHSAPVILAVFDEFPVISLLDGSGNIDAIRFPHFAELAATSTWYSQATTVGDSTTYAIPALLTGRYHTQGTLPIYQDHPVSLFTQVAPSHELQILESVTRMAPPDGSSNLTGDEFAIGPFVNDLIVLYLHTIAPASFAHRLPSINDSWRNFGIPENTRASQMGPVSDETATETRPRVFDFKADYKNRVKRFRQFIASMERSDRPTLYYIHTLLPHSPWIYLPTGQEYSLSTAVTGVAGPHQSEVHGHQWTDDEWIVMQGYQRHLLQLGFLDNLVGDMSRKLKKVGIFDDALIIITADHGASFNPGDNRRSATPTNTAEIARVPLLIKLPGQKEGRVVTDDVRLVDVFPTVMEVLGISIDTSIDGHSLVGGQIPSRGDVRLETDLGDTKFSHPLPGFESMLQRKLQWFGEGSTKRLFEIGPHRHLLGRRLTDLAIGPPLPIAARLAGEHLYAHVRKSSGFVPQDVRGWITGAGQALIFPMAVAVNGTIAGVTRTYQGRDAYQFSSLIPAESLVDGANILDLFAIDESEGNLKLRPLGLPTHGTYTLVGDKLLKNGAPLSPGAPEWKGWVISRLTARAMPEVAGWAGNVQNGRTGEIVVFADGRLLATTPCELPRQEAAKTFGQSGLATSGFSVIFSPSQFQLRDRTRIRVFVVSDDGFAAELFYPNDPAHWIFATPDS